MEMVNSALALPPSEPSTSKDFLEVQPAGQLAITLNELASKSGTEPAGASLPSPAVLNAADALAEIATNAVCMSSFDHNKLRDAVAFYRAARGPQPEQGELIRGAEKP